MQHSLDAILYPKLCFLKPISLQKVLEIVVSSTTLPWINRKGFVVSEGSLCFKPVLVQNVRLSPGLPKMNPVTFGMGKGCKIFLYFTWGDC